MSRAAALLSALCLASSAAAQDGPDLAAGRAIVEANCAACHAIGRDDLSRHPDAPAFRTLHEKYPLENLEEALAEGIYTGHPDMPEFQSTPREIADIIAYLASLSGE